MPIRLPLRLRSSADWFLFLQVTVNWSTISIICSFLVVCSLSPMNAIFKCTSRSVETNSSNVYSDLTIASYTLLSETFGSSSSAMTCTNAIELCIFLSLTGSPNRRQGWYPTWFCLLPYTGRDRSSIVIVMPWRKNYWPFFSTPAYPISRPPDFSSALLFISLSPFSLSTDHSRFP